MAAEYFLQKGFRNFAFYGTRGIDFSDERCQGFRETIEAANPEFTFSSLRSSAQNDLWYYDSTQLITWLQSLPKPVAIMACDDNQAYHITEACLQIEGGGNSRIPNDIAILGVDNDETICKLSTPNLSSLNQGVEQGGYDVARLIDRLIRNPEAEWEDVMVMPTHIVTRQSTDIYANNDPHIAEVLRYIHENISQKITVNEVVKLVPLSRRLLETRFKKSMGTSIYDYIIQVRIEKMMQLLCEGQSVSEAAAELGFSDIKNVSRTFRQLKGITPSEYREQFARRAVPNIRAPEFPIPPLLSFPPVSLIIRPTVIHDNQSANPCTKKAATPQRPPLSPVRPSCGQSVTPPRRRISSHDDPTKMLKSPGSVTNPCEKMS